MLEYIIKITTNTFPAIVPFALLVAVIYRTDRSERKRYLSGGIFTGFFAALVYAVLKRNTGFAVREYYDLGALCLSLGAGFFLILPLRRLIVLNKNNLSVQNRFPPGVVFCAAAAWTAYSIPNILLFPFEFAVGMDTIFNTEFVFKVAGYSLGLLLMLLAGIAVYMVAANLRSDLLFCAFALGLLVLLSGSALSVAQILLGRNMIPRYSLLTSVVIWMITHENAFMYVFMGISLFLAFTLYFKAKMTNTNGDNPAQTRKKKYLVRRQIRFCVSVLLCMIISLMTVTVGVTYSNKKVELSPPVEIPADGGRIVIPIERVNDGNLHRFVHRVIEGDSATDVRYIVIRKNETTYGIGLDACDVCGASGYFQRKDQVVCILCDVVMNISTIGLPGGCNPVPLKFTIESGNIIIMTDDLEAEVGRFY
jgi:uncharacterized membrane protein